MGDKFYIVEEGRAKASKTLDKDQAPIDVMIYKQADYFGERALISN